MTAGEAQRFLSWRFSKEDHQRVATLLDKNSAGSISGDERAELAAFVEAGDILGAIQARAKRAILDASH